MLPSKPFDIHMIFQDVYNRICSLFSEKLWGKKSNVSAHLECVKAKLF